MKSRNRPSAVRRCAFHVERLEDRCLMDGDPVPVEAVVEPVPIDIELVPIQPIFIDTMLPVDWDWWRPVDVPQGPADDPLFADVSEIPDWLADEIDNRYGDLFGSTRTYPDFGWYRGWGINAMLASDRAVALNAVGTTNTQVAGVDEADLIETDGEFLYMITGRELVIIDVRDAGNLIVASRVELDEQPTGIYLSGDRLTLVSTNQGQEWSSSPLRIAVDDFWYPSSHRYQPKTTVTVLDIANPSAPTQVQKTELDGSVVSSRMVDGELRLVLQHFSMNLIDHLPQIKYQTHFDEASQRHSYTHESRESYLARVQQTLSKSLVPGYRTLNATGEILSSENLVALEDMVRPGAYGYNSATTIATFDTLGDVAGPIDTTTIHTATPAIVYGTEESIYLFGKDYGSENAWQETAIWKFDFDGDDHSIQLAATGVVAGDLLNQFSADEHDGHLRVVTAVGWGWEGQTLSVLEQDDDELKLVASVTGLAPSEQIYSVRFMGDQAFVVTFRIVDPLFAIDLSDPTAPEVRGELKIPGYSDYLQSLDENFLISVGRGADETTGFFQELQLSIFDVTDLDDPQLAHRYSFDGGRETTTPVTGSQWGRGDGDHHAFSYFPSEGILALPVAGADGVSGLEMFSIDVTAGITPIATITHDSSVLRSLQIGDKLVVISAGEVSVHEVDDPATEIDRLDLDVETDAQLVELTDYTIATLSVVSDESVREFVWLGDFRVLSTVDDAVVEELAVEAEQYLFDSVRSADAPFVSLASTPRQPLANLGTSLRAQLSRVSDDLSSELAAEMVGNS